MMICEFETSNWKKINKNENSWAFNQQILSFIKPRQIEYPSGGPLRFKEEDIEGWFQAVQEFQNKISGGKEQ